MNIADRVKAVSITVTMDNGKSDTVACFAETVKDKQGEPYRIWVLPNLPNINDGATVGSDCLVGTLALFSDWC